MRRYVILILFAAVFIACSPVAESNENQQVHIVHDTIIVYRHTDPQFEEEDVEEPDFYLIHGDSIKAENMTTPAYIIFYASRLDSLYTCMNSDLAELIEQQQDFIEEYHDDTLFVKDAMTLIASIEDSQKQWACSLDADAEVYAAKYSGGTIIPLMIISYKIEAVKARIELINDWITY